MQKSVTAQSPITDFVALLYQQPWELIPRKMHGVGVTIQSVVSLLELSCSNTGGFLYFLKIKKKILGKSFKFARMPVCDYILYSSLLLDCSPPFGVSIRTSNEDTKGYTEAQLDANSASGTVYILGH